MPASLNEAFKPPSFGSSSSYTSSSLSSLKNPNYHGAQGGVQMGQIGGQRVQRGGGLNDDSISLFGSSLDDFDEQVEEIRKQYGAGATVSGSVENFRPFCKVQSQQKKAQKVQLAKQNQVNLDISDSEAEEEDLPKKIAKMVKSEVAEQKKKKLQCDMYIYHILSCSCCRKKITKILKETEDIDCGECSNGECSNGSDNDDIVEAFQSKMVRRSKKKNRSIIERMSEQTGGVNFNLAEFLQEDNIETILKYLASGILLILLLDTFKRLK